LLVTGQELTVTVREVGDMVLTLNTDNQAAEILEGQRRYREMLATARAEGVQEAEEKYEKIIADKDAELAEKDVIIANNAEAMAEKDATIADVVAQKDAALNTVAQLQAEIERLKM
jgi:DNA repair exonuclease SbcCD ATPase subunit